MDLTSINESMKIINNKIKSYLDNMPNIPKATFEQQMDSKYIADMYNNIVFIYSDLLKLITEEQYFVSQCKKVLRMLSGNTTLESQQKKQINTAIDIVEEQIQPLYTEKERLKTIEMFYRSVYTKRDF